MSRQSNLFNALDHLDTFVSRLHASVNLTERGVGERHHTCLGAQDFQAENESNQTHSGPDHEAREDLPHLLVNFAWKWSPNCKWKFYAIHTTVHHMQKPPICAVKTVTTATTTSTPRETLAARRELTVTADGTSGWLPPQLYVIRGHYPTQHDCKRCSWTSQIPVLKLNYHFRQLKRTFRTIVYMCSWIQTYWEDSAGSVLVLNAIDLLQPPHRWQLKINFALLIVNIRRVLP